MAASTVYGAVSEVTTALGLKEHFVIMLLAEDDWSYVIKAHTLAEAAIRRAIEKQVDAPGLSRFTAGLSMSQRLKMAESISAVSPELIRQVKQLTKIRNRLAHDVSEVGFTFASYLQDADARNGFFGAFLDGVTGDIEICEKTIEKQKFFRENPKFAVNEALFSLLLDVYVVDARAKLRVARAHLAQQLFEATRSHPKT